MTSLLYTQDEVGTWLREFGGSWTKENGSPGAGAIAFSEDVALLKPEQFSREMRQWSGSFTAQAPKQNAMMPSNQATSVIHAPSPNFQRRAGALR